MKKNTLLLIMAIVLSTSGAILAIYTLRQNKTHTETIQSEPIETSLKDFVPSKITKVSTIISKVGDGEAVEDISSSIVTYTYKVADASTGKIVYSLNDNKNTASSMSLSQLPPIVRGAIVGKNVSSVVRIYIPTDLVDSVSSLYKKDNLVDGIVIELVIEDSKKTQ